MSNFVAILFGIGKLIHVTHDMNEPSSSKKTINEAFRDYSPQLIYGYTSIFTPFSLAVNTKKS